ncbi:MAG: organoarsenical effux MFS transporter ArsJ [Myxococcales bacterium]|nr:organoarsenical effux MFS transporter ArsJ [Myxococcales bacterium]
MAASRTGLRDFSVVTGAYWAFTLTDGALRMLVLLHFHALGYSPFQLALLFVLYEAAGVITTLSGGVLASRVGLKATLSLGMLLQVAALLMLSALAVEWPKALQVAYVVGVQGISGIAKDLTKVSAKSAIKVVTPAEASGTLFRWVALMTGSKNALKGVGFFLGGVLLAALGFEGALWAMAATVLAGAVGSLAMLPGGMGKVKAKKKLAQLLSRSRAVNILSVARVLLFGARDVWFVVALPVFLHDVLGWSFAEVGAYMALWVIGYGIVQSATPRFLKHGPERNEARPAQLWGFLLSLSPVLIVIALRSGVSAPLAVLAGLAIFGVLFAINSAVHSYLILAYADDEQVSANVGFYYAANAVGRLAGTLLSGLVYQLHGLQACLLVAALMLAASATVALALPDTRQGAPSESAA